MHSVNTGVDLNLIIISAGCGANCNRCAYDVMTGGAICTQCQDGYCWDPQLHACRGRMQLESLLLFYCNNIIHYKAL